ncbi:hypothetical protein BH09VER1_BH09VER1_24400 [soil metagenome]
MKTNFFPILLGCGILWAGIFPMLGEDIANISPTVPNDPNLAKVTMLRLWYVGGVKAPQITLVREPEGKAPFVIESHLQAGIFSPYVALRPGKFLLHILDGKVIAPKDPMEKLPLKESKLVDPINLTLEGGTYETLIVTEKDGLLSAKVVEDKRPADSSAPVMRVQNLSGLENWTIKLLDQKQNLIRELWSSSAGGTGIPISLPGAGIFRVEVTRESNGSVRQRGLFETKLAMGAPFTMLLYPGSDGRGSCNLVFDAAPGYSYNADRIKAVANDRAVGQ